MPGIQRAQTFDVARGAPSRYYDYGDGDYEYDGYDRAYDSGRRRSHDGEHSVTSSHRSHRSRRSHRHRSRSRSRTALTESNLRTLSEVSATTPSVAPRAYRSPYAETAPRDMALSRPTLVHAATMPIPSPAAGRGYAPTVTDTASPVSTPRQSMLVHRPRSGTHLRSTSREIDTHLAYGSIPPDLESRTDLELSRPGPPDLTTTIPRGLAPDQLSPALPHHEQEARTLMQRIEGFLDEAHCLQHSAGAMIAHLQARPEAAAAVALTLAELSALLGKMSPAFLGVVKGGSPAVFALLASPQFLIGAGVAVGVTVVMFGGWKIVKRIQQAKKEMENPAAFEMQPQPQPQPQPHPSPGDFGFAQGAAFGGGGGGPGFDEALVIEEELSTIESWVRGIAAAGEDGPADLELISPEAERAMRERHREGRGDDIAPDDSASGVGSRTRTRPRSRSEKTSHRSHRSRRDDDAEVPERKSSKGFKRRDGEDEDRDGDRESERSGRSERSHRSSRSKRTERTGVKAIEDGSKDSQNGLDAVLRKEKKPNMLKTLFKKKKDKEEKDRTEISVLV